MRTLAESLYFVGLRLWGYNLRLWTPALKTSRLPTLDSGPKLQLRLYDLLCDILIAYLQYLCT